MSNERSTLTISQGSIMLPYWGYIFWENLSLIACFMFVVLLCSFWFYLFFLLYPLGYKSIVYVNMSLVVVERIRVMLYMPREIPCPI